MHFIVATFISFINDLSKSTTTFYLIYVLYFLTFIWVARVISKNMESVLMNINHDIWSRNFTLRFNMLQNTFFLNRWKYILLCSV